MGIAAKLDQLQNLRQLDDAAAALPIPKAVDDAPVDAADVRKAAPEARAVDSDMFNAFVTGIAEDLRAGEPVNPLTQTRARAMWLAMPPEQKAALIRVEGNGPKIVQALEGTPHNMLGDVEPDALLTRANLASKEQFPEGLPKREQIASVETAQGKVPRATADDVRGINRSIEGLLIDNKLQGKRHKELQNKLTGMGYEVLPTDDGGFRVRLPRPKFTPDGSMPIKQTVDGNWRPLIEGFQKDLPEIPDKQLRADRRAARTAQTGQPARDQVLIDKRMEPRGADPTSGKVVGDKVTGELGRQTENDFGYLPSERSPQRKMAGDLATTASGGAQVNPVAPITHKGGNPLENVIAKEVTPGSSPNPAKFADLQAQLDTRQRDARNAGAFANYKKFVFEEADKILDQLDDPNLDAATRKALELENQKLMSSYTEEVAKERQLNPNFDPVNPQASVQRNLSSMEVLQRELNIGDDANVDPLFEPDSQTPRIYRDSDVPQTPTEAENLGVIEDFQETGGRRGVGGGQRRDSDRIAAMEEFFTEQKRLPKEDEINPATGELYFPDGKPLGMGMKAESLRPMHTFFNDVDGVPARFKDVDDAAYKFAIYQGHAPGTAGFDAATEGFKRTLDRLMDGKDPTLPTAKTLDIFDDTADATEAMSNNPAVLDRNRAAQPGPDPEVDPLAPSTFKPATPVGTPVERRPMIVDPVTGRTGRLLEDLSPRVDMPEKPEKFDPKNNAIHKGLANSYNIKTQEQFNRHVYRDDFSPEPKQRPEPPVDTRPELGPEVPLDDPFDGDPNAIPVETSARGKPADSKIVDSRERNAKKVKELKETLDDADSSTKKTPRLDPDTQKTVDADEYSEAVKGLKKKGNRKKGEPNQNTALSNEDLKRISRGEARLDGGEVVDGPAQKDFEDLEPLSGADDMDNRDLPPMDEYDDLDPLDPANDPLDPANYDNADLNELVSEADSLGLDMDATREMDEPQLRAAVKKARTKANREAKKAADSKSQQDSLADDNLNASDPNKQVIDDVEPLDDAANQQRNTTDKSEQKKVDDAGDAEFIPDKEEPATPSGGDADSTPNQNLRRQPKQADKSGSGKGKKGWLRRGAELGGVLGAGAVGIFALQQALGPRGAGSITGGGPEGVRKDEGSVSGGGGSGVLPGETMSRDEELDAAASLQKIRDARRAAAGGGDRRLQTTHNFIGRSKGRF